MVAHHARHDVDVAAAELLEGVEPRALETDGEPAGVSLVFGDVHLARAVADAGAERLGDGLLRAPEADYRLRRIRRIRRQLEFLRNKHARRELLGKVAGDGFDIYADARVRRRERDDELRRVRVGLARVVAPDLYVGVAPPRLVEVLQIPPDGLLRGDAPEQPLGATRRGARHVAELFALLRAEDDVGERLQPKLLVPLEDRIRDVGDERARDVGRGVSEHVGRDAAREKRVGRLEDKLAVLRGNALGELLPAGE